jgi:hypothetical protein
MEPMIEDVKVAGEILEIIALSLLLLGWLYYLGQLGRS